VFKGILWDMVRGNARATSSVLTVGGTQQWANIEVFTEDERNIVKI